MPDGGDDHTPVVVQGDVGETVQAEEKAENKEEEQQRLEGNELESDDELKQRVIARQEEKGKGELSAATEEDKEVADSELLAGKEQRKRTPKKDATSATSKQKEQQPNLYNLSKQLESHTRQLSRIGSIVEQLPRYLKNANTQSKMIKQINSSINQLQKQVVKIQKRKSKQK